MKAAAPGRPAGASGRWGDSYRDRYGIVLVLVVLTMIAMAWASSDWGRLLALVIEGGTLLFILWTTAVRPRTIRIAAVLIVGALILASSSIISGGESASVALAGVGALLAMVAPALIARRLLQELRITAATVLGALCLYLLAGMFFAYVFAAVSALNQGRFFVQVTNAPAVDYVYFSLVTLTTLGYGDFTASSPIGKMLAVTEALAGQLYLVSVVAILVGNIGRTTRRGVSQTGTAQDDTR